VAPFKQLDCRPRQGASTRAEVSAAGQKQTWRPPACQRCDLRPALFSEEVSEDQQGGYRYRAAPTQAVVEGRELMGRKRFQSVWDAIEDSPEAAENMKLRSKLMHAVIDHIEREA
jgi:hypothetical protein